MSKTKTYQPEEKKIHGMRKNKNDLAKYKHAIYNYEIDDIDEDVIDNILDDEGVKID